MSYIHSYEKHKGGQRVEAYAVIGVRQFNPSGDAAYDPD
jgi:hypothetical protein